MRIEKLSGGQRKRVSVAMELLTSPTLLFLDEPTSGLDPGYERSVMELLRKLAKGGRGVVVVTHNVQSLDLCDQVLFLAPGGVQAFCGPTSEALTFFGRSQYASVFQELEAAPAERWKRRRRRQTLGHDTQTRRAPAPIRADVWWRQLGTLCRRQLAILAADRRNLAYLLAEVLIPAILILAIVGRDSFVPNAEKLHSVRTLVGALAVSAAVIGSANAIREVVKELPVYYRERSVGLSRTSYLASKMLVIGAVTLLQVLILVVIATRGANGPDTSIIPGSPLLELTVDIALGGITAMALGLLISTMVSSSEKAMALVPVVFIVMWLFSGQAVDLQDRAAMRVIGYATTANWSMSLAAGSTSLAEIEDEAVAAANSALPPGTPGETVDHDPRWQHDGRQWLLGVLALTALTAVCFVGADRMLARKEPFLRR